MLTMPSSAATAMMLTKVGLAGNRSGLRAVKTTNRTTTAASAVASGRSMKRRTASPRAAPRGRPPRSSGLRDSSVTRDAARAPCRSELLAVAGLDQLGDLVDVRLVDDGRAGQEVVGLDAGRT